jgi:hypothetical protein
MALRLSASPCWHSGSFERLKSACEKRQSRYPRPYSGHYRCRQYHALPTLPPFLLLLYPVQSVFPYLASWNITAGDSASP